MSRFLNLLEMTNGLGKRDASGRVIVPVVATKALVLLPTRELAQQYPERSLPDR